MSDGPNHEPDRQNRNVTTRGGVRMTSNRTTKRLYARDWSTEPDGPGSGDDRYGEVPAQEVAA